VTIQSFVDIQAGLNPNQPRDDKGRFGETSGNKETARLDKEPGVFSKGNKNYTADETSAVLAYASQSGYKTINSYARTGKDPPEFKWSAYSPEKVAEFTKNLDSAIEHSGGLQADALLARGGKFGPAITKKLVPGAVFTDKGFLSTSTNLNIAKDFAGLAVGGSPVRAKKGTIATIFSIRAKKGTKYLKIAIEQEILFARGSKLRVISAKMSGTTIQVKADLE
jgi:hypothetical protein